MSRTDIREVRLEIVRPGKPHNQLLSPLTPYTALCGEGSPITFYIEFEHQQLLNRLERLRYVTRAGQTMVRVPPQMREAELAELGTDVARILAKIETLSPELARAQSPKQGPRGNDELVHLRLLVSGSELALVPFELAVAPLAYPGEGLEFSLQASLPVVVTREIRRGRPVPVAWNRGSKSSAPKVLFAYAEPGGLKVPAQFHLQAIRNALEPWIRHVAATDGEDAAAKRLPYVKKRLRVLPNASIESIYQACAEERFTHVHILAHGDTYEHAGTTRYGVALCAKDSPQQKEVVSGKRLAKALQAEDVRGCGRSDPLVVTLATCDSGNQMTVLVPGGSIAHDLHVEGVPWVFASQFPLTIPGSVRMAEALYPRLFRGDDPREVLFEVRRQLYQSAQQDHDWASIVAYATVSPDFSNEVSEFRARQMKEAINVVLDRVDALTEGRIADPARDGLTRAIDEVEEWLRTWRCGEPKGDTAAERLYRAEIQGMHGSTYKRLALMLSRRDPKGDQATLYYRKSLEAYRAAMSDAGAATVKYCWTATQSLCLQALRDLGAEQQIYALARALAERDIAAGETDSIRAWAHGTVAELDLLSTYHQPSGQTAQQLIERVEQHCREIARLMGPRSFHVGSTYRQFRRYLKDWEAMGPPIWKDIARAATEVLNPGGAYEFAYPEDD